MRYLHLLTIIDCIFVVVPIASGQTYLAPAIALVLIAHCFVNALTNV